MPDIRDGPLSGADVLVVDDNDRWRELLLSISYGLGARTVRQAGSGDDAFRMALDHDVSIVLSDQHMPEGSGLELVRRLRHTTKHRDTVFVLLSAEASSSLVEEARCCGVDYFLAKPINTGNLGHVIRKLRSRNLEHPAPRCGEDSSRCVLRALKPSASTVDLKVAELLRQVAE